jgi:hypothetical protein
MSATINLIMDGLKSLTGSTELFGFIIVIMIVIGFLILRMPILASVAMILPLGYVMAQTANLPIWTLAVLLIIAGGVLYWIIKNLISG